MNKNLTVVNIVLWSFLAIALTAFLVLAIGSNGFSLSDRFYSSSGNGRFPLVVDGSSENTYEVKIDKDISRITLEWIDGIVSIRAHDENYILARQYVSRGVTEKRKMEINVSAEELRIEDSRNRWRFPLWGFGRHYATDVSLFLPLSLYEEIVVEGVSARLDIKDINTRKLILETVSGRINLEDVHSEKLEAEAVAGSLNLGGTFSSIKAETVSGSIAISSDILAKQLETNTISGTMEITLPENAGFTLQYEKVTGSLSSEFPFIAENSGVYRYKTGGPEFYITTISGNCRIYNSGAK